MKKKFQLTFRLLLLSLLIPCTSQSALGQNDILELERNVNQLHGTEKLLSLHQLTDYFLLEGNDKKALKYALQAEVLTNNFLKRENSELNDEDFRLKALTYMKLGEAFKARDRYMESKNSFMNVISLSEEMNIPELKIDATQYIRSIDSLITFGEDKPKRPLLANTFRDIVNAIDKTSNDFEVTATLKMAKIYEDNDDLKKSIKQYQIAMNLLRDLGDFEKIRELEDVITNLQSELVAEGLSGIQKEVNNLGEIEVRSGKLRQSSETAASGRASQSQSSFGADGIKSPKLSDRNPDEFRSAARRAESRLEYKKSLDYYKQFLSLEQELEDERSVQQLALLEQANEIENRDREIMLLKQNDQIQELELAKTEVELKNQRAAKRNLALGLGLLGLILFGLYYRYYSKQKAHRKLGAAYDELKTTQDNLQLAQVKIKSLLHQQVSGAVADELLAATGDHKNERRLVCIMFLDIRDFTVYAETRNPEEIIDYQNKIFGFMINTVNKHHGIVNQILGDGFMATFGAPLSSGNDCRDAYLAAKEIISKVEAKSTSGEIPPTKVGIGLHSGYVVTGNVGTKDRKQYSITGNPVIIASRLEQLNKIFGSSIVISKNVYDQLPEANRAPMTFSKVNVKGRSEPVEVAAI